MNQESLTLEQRFDNWKNNIIKELDDCPSPMRLSMIMILMQQIMTNQMDWEIALGYKKPDYQEEED